MKKLEIQSDNLQRALRVAIQAQGQYEKAAAYTADSALLAGWKETLKTLEEGGELVVKKL